MINVYDELRQALINAVGLSPAQAQDVVNTLDALDVLDYDALKEVFLYEDE
jgi:hypothetical protein